MTGRQIIFPLIFILLGLARELMFPSASLAAEQGLVGSSIIIILLFGGIGFLMSLCEPSQVHQPFEEIQLQEKDFDKTITEDALENIGLMTAGLVHNFRNYLQIMETTNRSLQKYSQYYSSIQKTISIQKKCINQARDTANQILWFARRDDKKDLEHRPINEIVEDALVLAELLLKEKSIEIVRDYEQNACLVPVNDISLMQSVINLVKNSAQAAPDKSKIVVSTRFTEHKFSYEFCIVVKDSGTGIQPEQQENLFKPLSSKSPNGTGLGLYTVKRLVEDEGGQVEVHSNKEKGTEVHLRYPMILN